MTRDELKKAIIASKNSGFLTESAKDNMLDVLGENTEDETVDAYRLQLYEDCEKGMITESERDLLLEGLQQAYREGSLDDIVSRIQRNVKGSKEKLPSGVSPSAPANPASSQTSAPTPTPGPNNLPQNSTKPGTPDQMNK